jgi:ribosomal protein L11
MMVPVQFTGGKKMLFSIGDKDVNGVTKWYVTLTVRGVGTWTVIVADQPRAVALLDHFKKKYGNDKKREERTEAQKEDEKILIALMSFSKEMKEDTQAAVEEIVARANKEIDAIEAAKMNKPPGM